MKDLLISGFSDEISDNFIAQLEWVKELGMNYISIRGVDGKNFADYSLEEVEKQILPKLNKYSIKVSSIGSPIGKIFINEEDKFKEQQEQLKKLCQGAKLLGTNYIRMFSFYIPKGENPDNYKDEVLKKLKVFIKIARENDIILLHENEKDIYGDTDNRCQILFENLYGSNFKGIFDFANFVQVETKPLEAYDKLKKWIEYIHIKDASYDVSYNVLAGTGDGEIPLLLKKFIVEDGYKGFLTLEPHLAEFGSLKDLELDDEESVIADKSMDGKTGYQKQYLALKDILNNLEVSHG